MEEYVQQKVQTWITEVEKLAEFGETQPQAAYMAFILNEKPRWNHIMRTIPDISSFFEPLEKAIKDIFIPAITKKENLTQGQRDLLSLPTGMGISNPVIMTMSIVSIIMSINLYEYQSL